jgi:hypothetical protein
VIPNKVSKHHTRKYKDTAPERRLRIPLVLSFAAFQKAGKKRGYLLSAWGQGALEGVDVFVGPPTPTPTPIGTTS